MLPPTPAEIPGEPVSRPEAEATTEALAEVAAPEDVPVVVADEEELHERSYRGVVVRVLPTIPKLGDGVLGAAS